jgi:hypothetical protein
MRYAHRRHAQGRHDVEHVIDHHGSADVVGSSNDVADRMIHRERG